MIMSGFMAALGHIEVRAEQEGLKFVHAAGDWVDHLTWDQVKHLLAPAVRDVAPGALDSGDVKEPAPADSTDGASEGPSAFTTIPTDVLDELKTLFGSWFQRELDGIRSEVGKELDAVHRRIDAVAGAIPDGASTAAKKAAARKVAARKPAAAEPASASK